MDRAQQQVTYGLISPHVRGGKAEKDALKVFLAAFGGSTPKKIAAGATAFSKLSSDVAEMVRQELMNRGVARRDIHAVMHSRIGSEKNTGFVLTSAQHKKAIRLCTKDLSGEDLDDAKHFFDSLHEYSTMHDEKRAVSSWGRLDTHVRDVISSALDGAVGKDAARKFLKSQGVRFLDESTKSEWTRAEVHAVVSAVLGPDQVDTFMQGCGGGDEDSIGYRELDATCAEILGSNFDLAKRVMSAFGFEYAGKKVPGAAQIIGHAVRTSLDESMRELIGIGRIDESVSYTVEVVDHSKKAPYNKEVARYDGVNLTKARQICKRAARRGVKMYGGEVSNSMWGSRGGDFPSEYRSATIRVGSMNESLNETTISTALRLAREWGFTPIQTSRPGKHVEYRLKAEDSSTQFKSKRGSALALDVTSMSEVEFKEWLTSHV